MAVTGGDKKEVQAEGEGQQNKHCLGTAQARQHTHEESEHRARKY